MLWTETYTYFQSEYKAIEQDCRIFACEYLDLCRTTHEIEMLFKTRASVKRKHAFSEHVEFPRLLEAASYDQKEVKYNKTELLSIMISFSTSTFLPQFLAHPSCQQVLQRKWFAGLPKWVTGNPYWLMTSFIYILLWCLLWPIPCLIYMSQVRPIKYSYELSETTCTRTLIHRKWCYTCTVHVRCADFKQGELLDGATDQQVYEWNCQLCDFPHSSVDRMQQQCERSVCSGHAHCHWIPHLCLGLR